MYIPKAAPPPYIDALRPSHAHYFAGISSETLEHKHLVQFFTYAVNGSAHDGHIHRFQGYTSVNDKHFHRFFGFTGPAIPLPDGSHIHLLKGEVDPEPFISKGNYYFTVLSVDRHTHRFSGPSGGGIGYGTWLYAP